MNNLSRRTNVIGLLLFLCLPVIVSGCLDAGEQMINTSPKATAPPPDSTSAPPSADSTPVPTFTATQSSVEIATATPTADLPIAPVEGARAPDFTLIDLNGDEMSLSNLRGQPLLLNFWATWWPYCRSERSALQKAYEQYHDQGFVVLSVDIGERRGTVQAFAQEQGLTFSILLDENSKVAQRYRVRGVPTSFFINREGVIQVQHIGPLDESLIGKYLDQIL